MSEQKFLPYSSHHVTDNDINAVIEVLKSDWLTQGPSIPEFEATLADCQGAPEAVACTSGTAALHLAMLALGLGEGDAIITTPNTFVATANCARFVGARVLFADIDPSTGLIDPGSVARLVENDTRGEIKAILPVHFAGQPADLPAIYDLALRHGAKVVGDASHAIGATYESNGQHYQIGCNPHSDLTVFSFHPVKHVAMGEGGAVVTDDDELANRLRMFRNHGIVRRDFVNSDLAFSADGIPNPWYYEMSDLGFNYRLTDIQAALGLSQIKRLKISLDRRREIADTYRRLIDRTFTEKEVLPLTLRPNVSHAYHLFVVRIDFANLGVSRAVVMNRLRANGIGTQVHYIPVHLQPYYHGLCQTDSHDLPGVEKYYSTTLSLPMYPELTESDIERVVKELASALTVHPMSTPAAEIKQENPVR